MIVHKRKESIHIHLSLVEAKLFLYSSEIADKIRESLFAIFTLKEKTQSL